MKYIGVYMKSIDKFVVQYKLSIDIETLSKILNSYKDDPDFDMIYPLTKEQTNNLIKYTEKNCDHIADMSKFEYFLESYRD